MTPKKAPKNVARKRTTTTRKRRGPTAADLKRQLAAMKLENKNQAEIIASMSVRSVPGSIPVVQHENLAELNPELAAANPELAGLTDPLAGMNAQDRPTGVRDIYESEDEPTNQGRAREMRSTGPANLALDPPLIEKVDGPMDKFKKIKMDALAFMEEEIIVRLAESTHENDVPIPGFWNDGIAQWFIRGLEQQVKRKFVEILARCKVTKFTQEKYLDANGDEAFRYLPHTVHAYPFEVIEDRNPMGRDWLKQLRAEV